MQPSLSAEIMQLSTNIALNSLSSDINCQSQFSLSANIMTILFELNIMHMPK